MLCFVCLTEKRDDPSKAVTYVQGTSVCREHLNAVGSTELTSVMNKIRVFADRLNEQRNKQPQLEQNGS